jgi:hypothetical protein
MADTPDVGFSFGVEGSDSLLSTIQRLRAEMGTLKTQQDFLASSAQALHGAWSALVSLGVSAAIMQLGREALQTGTSIGRMEQISGVSARTLSVLYKAAADVGIQHDVVDKGVTRLSRSLIQLQQGIPTVARGYALMGLSAKDFIGLNQDEALRKVIDRFGAMKDGAAKAAAAQEIFSRGGAALIPVMKQLAGEGFSDVERQAAKLGVLFDHDFAQAALRAEAAMQDLHDVGLGTAAAFETGFIPALNQAANAMVTGAVGGGNAWKYVGEEFGTLLKWIVSGLADMGIWVGSTAQLIQEDFGFAWNEVKRGASSVFAAFKEAATGDFSGALRALKDGVRDAGRDWDELQAKRTAIIGGAEQQLKAVKDALNAPGPTKPARTGADSVI